MMLLLLKAIRLPIDLRPSGKNYKEGYYTTSPVKVVKSRVKALDSIKLDVNDFDTDTSFVSGSNNDIEIAYNNDIMIRCANGLTRFSPNGTLRARYELKTDNPIHFTDWGEDDAGNLYLLGETDTNSRLSIVKLNASLEIQNRIDYTCPENYFLDPTLLVSGNGMVYLMLQSSSEIHSTNYHFSIFDSSLILTTSFEQQFQWIFGKRVRYDKTIVTKQMYNSNDPNQYYDQIGFLDFDFNVVNTYSNCQSLDQYRLPFQTNESLCGKNMGGPGGTIITCTRYPVKSESNASITDPIRTFLLISDRNNKILARRILNQNINQEYYRFDKTGNIHFFSHDVNSKKLTIYKYSTGWLLP
jgi:hypothetical protein